jgi:hypothetical protein
LPALLLIGIYVRRKWRGFTASLDSSLDSSLAAERNRDAIAEAEEAHT